MSTDWRSLCNMAGFQAKDHTIMVALSAGRSQKVYVEEEKAEGYLRIWSVAAARVARAKTGQQIESSLLRRSARELDRRSGGGHLRYEFAWRRNRLSDLVGFKIDRKGRLIGEAWVPTSGLEAEELAIYVNAMAQSCDRMEYLLTGKDQQ